MTYRCTLPCGCLATVTQFCPEAERLMGAIQDTRATMRQFTSMSRRPIPFEYHDAYDQVVQELMVHFGREGMDEEVQATE